ncbi:agamous-like MADS-box protein AGL9 homolog isoform X6 [Arachis ipaensis]|uniref:agamous-like MADS-box protein AGL9 homolog isoform X6 n=1 Tax=Arachis ipaensis TaxID=130454 RepID=UPI0007AEECFB|nr:agamous-like MADS-box protein AGL9 homolog isoform X6 [Arachis ipaensis]XP_029151404.1 agamous-like MADS-box protein AGL9 homolog isoform X6 [Arachis hypogaea]
MPSASEVYAAREKNRIYIPRDRYLSEEAEKKAMAEKIERMELEADSKDKELSSQQEYLKLKARYEALQRSQRNLMGEDLGLLSSKELESLERQLDSSLKLIRSTRTQFMLDQLSKLQRKTFSQLQEEKSSLLQEKIYLTKVIFIYKDMNNENVEMICSKFVEHL